MANLPYPLLLALWALSGLVFVFYLRRALTPAPHVVAPPPPPPRPQPAPPAPKPKPPKGEPSLHLGGFVSGDTVNYVFSTAMAEQLGARGVTVGRDIWMSDFVVRDDHLSKRHARFTQIDRRFMVEDLLSMNKTFLNDEPLTPFEPREVSNHDKLRLGRLEFTVTLRPDTGANTSGRVQEYSVITIGRADTNDIILQSKSSSRRHGELIVTDHQQYYLMDRSSGGGVRVYRDGDWRPLSAEFVLLDEWVAFSDEDVIQVSNILAQAGRRSS